MGLSERALNDLLLADARVAVEPSPMQKRLDDFQETAGGAPRRLPPRAGAPVTDATEVVPAEAGTAPLQQGSVMQRMMEAQAVAAAAQAAAAAKQDQMLKEMAEMKAEMKAQQDREMALLAQEFTALGSRTNFAVDAPAKKSSACAIQ